VRYDAAVREADRCALYFTVDLSPGRPAILIKFREDRQGRVTGSSLTATRVADTHGPPSPGLSH
jgi:hypothetical protein